MQPPKKKSSSKKSVPTANAILPAGIRPNNSDEELNIPSYWNFSQPDSFPLSSLIKNNNSPSRELRRIETAAYERQTKEPQKMYLDDPNNSISLTQGKMRGATPNIDMIKDLIKAADNNNIDRNTFLGLVAQESMFGKGYRGGQRFSGNQESNNAAKQQDIVSGWDVASEYNPIPINEFAYKKGIPNVKLEKHKLGYQFVADDSKFNKSLDSTIQQHPEYIEEYRQLQGNVRSEGEINYFDKAAKFIKDKGIGAYNPGDPDYSNKIRNTSNLVKNDPAIQQIYKQFNDEKMSTKMINGGSLTPHKAKEMLKDGTAHGKKLTSKQKKYFGLIASKMDKAQYGLDITNPLYNDPLEDSKKKINNYFEKQDPNLIPNNASLYTDPNQNEYLLDTEKNKVVKSNYKPLVGGSGAQGAISQGSGFNIDLSLGDILLPAIGAANQALSAANRTRTETDQFRRRATQKVYNPFRYGTGSQMLFQDGGKVTKLNNKQEKAYQTWKSNLPKNLQYEGDYDLKGLYLSNPNIKPSPNLHFPDTYKLPNHPTFSNESKYFNKNNINQAGYWENTDSSFNYIPYNPNIKDTVIERKMNNGGEISNTDNQDIQPLWGGNIDQQSYNSYSNPIINFEGNSHKNGGIGINYGGNNVEVENESGFIDNEGDLNIFGKMKVPGMNKTFNKAGKELGNLEAKATKDKDLGAKLINDSNPEGTYSQYSFNTGKVMFESADTKMKNITMAKEDLANTQNQLLNLSEQFGEDPESFSKNLAKYGKSMKKYADGGDQEDPKKKKKKTGLWWMDAHNYPQIGNSAPLIPLNQLPRGTSSDNTNTLENLINEEIPSTRRGKGQTLASINNNPGNIMFYEGSGYQQKLGATKGSPRYDKDGKLIGYFAKFPTQEAGLRGMESQLFDSKNYKNLTVDQAARRWVWGNQNDKRPGYSNIPEDLKGKKISQLTPEERKRAFDTFTIGEDSKAYNYIPDNSTPVSGDPKTPNTSVKPQVPVIPTYQLEDPDTIIPPPLDNPPELITPNTPNTPSITTTNRRIPSTRDNFNFGQIVPELFALATNTYDAVPSLEYQPQLYQPYQISLQDQLNQNQSDFNQLVQTVKQTNSPELLGQLAAQKYQADQSVLAGEFRTNQGISNDIYNKNIDILNNASLTNLNLQDVQQQRQAQARANTRGLNQAAINSISSKFLQNDLENKTLNVYENLYDYRFDPETQEAQYMGPDAVFTNPSGINTTTNPQNSEMIQYLYDKSGKRTGKVTTKDQLTQQNKALQIQERRKRMFGI